MLKVQGPQEWVFEECKNIASMTFRFKDKEKPQLYAYSLAGMMFVSVLFIILLLTYVVNVLVYSSIFFISINYQKRLIFLLTIFKVKKAYSCAILSQVFS